MPASTWRFSLSELMILITMVAFGLSFVTWFPPSLVAATLGTLATLGMLFVLTCFPESRAAYISWLAVTAMYLSAVLGALIHG